LPAIEAATETLRHENADPAAIHVTRNTMIDAPHATAARIDVDLSLAADLNPIAERFAGSG
jgi:UDP-N-acetylglucosamine 2-epimerase (non-hydrolysing)